MKNLKVLFLFISAMLLTLSLHGTDTVPDNQHVMEPSVFRLPYQTSMNPVDYGLIGLVVVSLMGLIGYVIKTDRADRGRIFEITSQERAQMVDALNNLKNSIESQRLSNERLSGELHFLVKSLESRVERMEDSVRAVEVTMKR